MSIYLENKLITKLLEEQDIYTLHKSHITPSHFNFTKDVYEFILDYFYTHKSLPDISSVVERFENFDPTSTADTLQYLCTALKDSTAKRLAFELLQHQVTEKFNETTGTQFLNWLKLEIERIIEITGMDTTSGSHYNTNEKERIERYIQKKQEGSKLLVPYPYAQLTKWLCGGSELGDYVLLLAHANKGKSWIVSDIAVYQWKQGFGVLHYAPELSRVQQEDRLDTLRFKVSNSAIRSASLSDEERYYEKLRESEEHHNKAPYIIKTMEDLPHGLGVEQIESDILSNPDIKIVVIDGFNLMKHNGKDTNRNNMSTTSRKLRQMFSRYGVLGIVVHQTTTASEKNSEVELESDGIRMIQPPKLTDYSECVAVIQDASTVLTFNAKDGIGVLFLAKSRTPFKDMKINLSVDFDRGFINAYTGGLG